MATRAVLAWLSMILVAIANGVIREQVYARSLGDHRAHQLSTLTGSVAMLGVATAALGDEVCDESDSRLLGIGGAWLAGTVLFEFSFGHYVDGKSWGELAADYNIAKGHLWPFVLLTILVSPLLAKWLRSVAR